ncbi:PadR family transcriptional regulator [Acholeplasma hippikon]|uniref:Lineage-specific thermal regulator protein n=1 Tax=Acholeplasma hippikon TaxID=264636 RepID=A0A449BJ59_9MOLU|nr:PadR family transcriptional regulator [Acholeplasma hippikon]VEU82433.1 lineage-specific thermal regulator protein [Acholeplasma hippikon]
MKVQIKKGLLDFCVLAALFSEDSYGYKLIQDTSDLIEISESTLYPILRRLEENKYLVSYTKEYQGRLRKYYGITSKGKQQVHQFLNEWKDMKKIYDFIVGKVENE